MPETERNPGRNSRLRLDSLLGSRLEALLLAPIRAFRLAYLPLLTIYLASGALGLIAVADTFWVKQSLLLFPIDRGVYDQLPSLVLAVIAIAVVLPLSVILALGRRLR